ncbi:lipid-A-disaccharide synthase [Thermovibrio sp.]
MEKLLIVSGELSGSLYAQELVKRLRGKFELFGVFHKEVEGAKRLYDSGRITAFGLFEVVGKLGEIRRALKELERFIREERPRALILIDFPGFNLKVAEIAKREGVKVLYFIPPKLWAWGEWRVKKLKELVDRLFVIFPFEVDFYKKFGIDALYVGNPLVDLVFPRFKKEVFFKTYGLKEPLFSLLPGSREGEVKRLLVPLLKVSLKFSGSWAIPVASTVNYGKVKRERDRVNRKLKLLKEELRYDLMAYSRAGVIASGTASLEASLLGLPHVVVYKVNPLTYLVAKRLVKTPFISLPNIIAGREVVPELIQGDATSLKIESKLDYLLEREEEVRRALKEEVRDRLEGNCFERLEEAILEELR